jgi:hypothetical protein
MVGERKMFFSSIRYAKKTGEEKLRRAGGIFSRTPSSSKHSMMR